LIHHVHIYDCFDLETFLDSALENFKAEAARSGREDAFTAVLLLTETAKENWFHRLARYVGDESGTKRKAIGNWTFHRTNEDCSLCAQYGNAQGLFLIAGRQIITAEDLEVLALAMTRNFEDGSPAEELIEAVKESGGIPAFPWGFGKWLGQRGSTLTKILNTPETSGLFLGDNGNRPNFWPRPSHFKMAQAKGIRILPGSDPLPFFSERHRPGSFGFSISGSIASEYPARDLKRILLEPKMLLKAYGQLERPWRFFRNQLAMQLIKHLRRAKSVN